MITSVDAAVAAINAAGVELRLPAIRAESGRIADEAAREKISYLPFLAECLAAEIDVRTQRRMERRLTEAKFPRMKRLEDFDIDAGPKTVTPALIASLREGGFIDTGNPVVFLGDSGTGKSHLLIGTGVAAAREGKRVRYVTTAALVNELSEAADDKMLSRLVGRYGRLDLLCLDELGYVKLDTRGAELLFQVITEREERSSIAVASNAPFSEWGRTFTDARLVAAVVDRLTFNATIVECGTESFRLRSTRSKKEAKTT
jgi:DNA replication protein DnaC